MLLSNRTSSTIIIGIITLTIDVINFISIFQIYKPNPTKNCNSWKGDLNIGKPNNFPGKLFRTTCWDVRDLKAKCKLDRFQ